MPGDTGWKDDVALLGFGLGAIEHRAHDNAGCRVDPGPRPKAGWEVRLGRVWASERAIESLTGQTTDSEPHNLGRMFAPRHKPALRLRTSLLTSLGLSFLLCQAEILGLPQQSHCDDADSECRRSGTWGMLKTQQPY